MFFDIRLTLTTLHCNECQIISDRLSNKNQSSHFNRINLFGTPAVHVSIVFILTAIVMAKQLSVIYQDYLSAALPTVDLVNHKCEIGGKTRHIKMLSRLQQIIETSVQATVTYIGAIRLLYGSFYL